MATSASETAVRIDSAGLTHTGRVRKQNEDSILVRPDLGLFVVADGMGGHQAGDVASRITVETLEGYFQRTLNDFDPTEVPREYRDLDVGAQRLLMAILLANKNVREKAESMHVRNGMGSTVAAIHVCPDGSVHIAHLGDSRVYRISGGEFEQITQDHSFVNQVRWRAPNLDPELLGALPKNVITAALGMNESPEVEVRTELCLSGDAYLICSDGLSGFVSSEQMLDTVLQTDTLEQACQKLVDAANDGGGRDNVSVVLVRIERAEELTERMPGPPDRCPKCGFAAIPGYMFCVECGNRLLDGL